MATTRRNDPCPCGSGKKYKQCCLHHGGTASPPAPGADVIQRAMMRILGVSGSLRAASTNTRLLLAATQLAPPDVDLRLTSSVATLPLFSPDLDPGDMDVVDRWVAEVREADGIIVSTPEYARGYPGALKNAFDWLVGTDAYVNKPFMLLNASSRSTVAQDTFAVVLETMSGIYIRDASTTIPLLGTKLSVSEIVANEQFADSIRESILIFVSAIEQRESATAT